jgi:CubicO group peptidase (beta-lactamase class C family)
MPSFSVSKSVVAALTGIAISEGYIESVKDPVTKYLDIFKHPGFDKITIEDCLNMRSGIRFNEGYYNPFGEVAKFYYGRNLERYVAGLRVKELPDLNYEYIGANTQILGFIIEKTTGKRLSEYLQEKIWKPMGAEYSASWNYDSKKHQNIKAFCCLNGRLRDFAKFGRLFLDNGKLFDPPIVPPEWINATFTIDKDSRDSQNYPYSYHWRVMDNGALFAKGILGQFLYVNPNKNIVMVRFGRKASYVIWPELFNHLAEEL